MQFWSCCLLIIVLVQTCYASVGDNSKFFQHCVRECDNKQCAALEPYSTSFWLRWLGWDCVNECEYLCMWKTTALFISRGYKIPQFYGKWPFIRMFGVQEPASVIFSLFNLYAHVKGLQRIRREISVECPTYWLWHIFTLVCVNAWIWSSVFHTRDTPHTEFLDYSCAFSMILVNCFAMTMRVLKDLPRFMRIILTVFFIAFYANHVMYLSIGRFDYSYNMQVNLIVATFSALCWFAWCVYNRYRQPYVWKLAFYVSLCGITTLLELIDKPPLWYILDFHALWHLSTALITPIFYSFIIDDCIYLLEYLPKDDIEKVTSHKFD